MIKISLTFLKKPYVHHLTFNVTELAVRSDYCKMDNCTFTQHFTGDSEDNVCNYLQHFGGGSTTPHCGSGWLS